MNNSEFVFFHGYDEKLWKGFAKRGFIGKASGIRFCQNALLDENKKFNRLTADGSPLRGLLAENDFPLYIDRLQGGAYIDDYCYDMRIIDALGDKFFGFQMHEWMSNLRSDYKKLSELPPDGWSTEGITKEIFRRFPFPRLFLEAASAKEFAEELPLPKNYEDFLKNAEKLYLKRCAETRGELIPCDSVIMATNLEIKSGAKRIMPEIGAQTSGANVQLAYARGMARAYSRSFGAYYEPWGGEPFSVCCYQRDGGNEWNIGSEDFPFKANGSEGGSSRSLQRRLYLYAYLAGASFMSEEWGLYNTFLDTDDFEISPYGRVKLDFLRFIENQERGEFFAPIAIVLPADMMALHNVFGTADSWFGKAAYADEKFSRRERLVADGIRSLMFDSLSCHGNETQTFPNSDVPDAFDILHEDCESAFSRYEYLVDLTDNPAFSRTHKNVLSVEEAKNAVTALMPCGVSGGLHWFVCRASDYWLLTVFNNDGIDKSAAGGEIALSEAERTAVIDLKGGSSLVRLGGCSEIVERDGKYYVPMKAGEIFLARVSQ